MDDLQQHHITHDKAEDREWRTRDDRSPMETRFTREDIDKHVSDARQRWRLNRALTLQEGQWVQSYESLPSRSDQNRAESRKRQSHIVADNAELTEYQSQRVEHIFTNLPNLNTFGPYSLEEILVGVVCYVVESDDASRIDDFTETERFSVLADTYDSNPSRAKTVQQKVDTLTDDQGGD